MDHLVVVAGAPRSGTSWLGALLDSSPYVAYRFQPFFSYAFKDRVHTGSPREDFVHLFQKMSESTDSFLVQRDRRQSGEHPTFPKMVHPTHLAFKTCRYQYLLPLMVHYFENLYLLAIVRHPCAVLNSWRKVPSEFPEGADFEKEWRAGACKNEGRPEEFFGFYKWRELCWLYLDLQERNPERVRVVSYEDLVDDTEGVTDRLFRFVHLRITESTQQFIQDCHARHDDSPYAVFKAKEVRDAWQNEISPDIQRAVFRELSGTRLERFLC